MGKNLKLNIKNSQISKAVNLKGIKEKLAKKKVGDKTKEEPKGSSSKAKKPIPSDVQESDETRQSKVRARSKSAFEDLEKPKETPEVVPVEPAQVEEISEPPKEEEVLLEASEIQEPVVEKIEKVQVPPAAPTPIQEKEEKKEVLPIKKPTLSPSPNTPSLSNRNKLQLGPTGRHIKDLIPPKPKKSPDEKKKEAPEKKKDDQSKDNEVKKTSQKPKPDSSSPQEGQGEEKSYKTFKDVKPKKKQISQMRSFDSRDRLGLRSQDDEDKWRKKRVRTIKKQAQAEIEPVRPSKLSIRLPIELKELASQMKLKASQLISKLFMQGVVVTLNDILDDETTIQLLGQEFACEISVDTSAEDRIRITDKSIKEEINEITKERHTMRPPVVAFMGHVDHGKTSLIDSIRQSNITSTEAGAITQHMGAFCVKTKYGPITILDTPGHEAFSAMRVRGANVTDLVILVVAGDEGIRQQTLEAIQHAKAASVPILVAINKCDKPNFDDQEVFRQLADQELLPEAWGGQTITVNCSAHTKEGIDSLLEMIALQSEVLELTAVADTRARGTVIESEMHKGMGAIATLLIQNGTLKIGDALVFQHHWGRVKTLHDEHLNLVTQATPSQPIRITGLSGLPTAGDEFIVVSSEREAKEISDARMEGSRQQQLLQSRNRPSLENLLQRDSASEKKILNAIIRADAQGSLEALRAALMKIESDKIDLNIILSSIGEISESDIQLAAASKAIVIGFHTVVESHAEILIKQLDVNVKLYNVIYAAVEDIQKVMTLQLDKIMQENNQGLALVKQVFKASQLGKIAGCQVTEGNIKRAHKVRLLREGKEIWKGSIASLKREKDDVKEVQKGFECGILLEGNNDILEGDEIQSFEIEYISQEL